MTVTDVQEVAWDLEPLVEGEGEPGADRMLAEADERAAAFAERYAGHVKDLDGAGLAAAMDELQAISELVEGMAQRRSCALRRKPAPPGRTGQAPADLDRGQDGRQERRHRQSDEA